QAAASLRVGVGTAQGQPTLFLAVDPARLQQVIKIDTVAGSFDDLGLDGVALSKSTADDRHLGIGDAVPVHFLTPAAGGSTSGAAPAPAGDLVLRVKAISDSSLLQGSSGFLISQQLFAQVF